MKRVFYGSLLTAILMPSLTMAAPAAKVTNGNDYGPGSLRSALESGATKIVIKGSVNTIKVTKTLKYTGTLPLKISGSGQIIDGTMLSNNLAPILEVTQGADLEISNLSFDGGGGYDIFNQGGGKGIFVDVPVTRTGVVNVKLNNVSVTGVGNHGVHVSDCTLGDDCGGGGGGAGDGSPASIYVQLTNVLIDGAGFGKADADGVRIDDRNDGDISFSATNSTFVNVGADGVELDEGNNGNVYLDVRNSTFDRNGEFCAAIDPPVKDGPCDDEGVPDVDDGFDVDEAGPGSIFGKIRNVYVTDNFDEGLDFDEEDEGGFELQLINVLAEGNTDEGIKISEENDGDVLATLRSITSQLNNGAEIEEDDSGDVRVTVTGSMIHEELTVSEDGSGEGTLKVRGSSIDALDLKNVDEI